jgi:two-component system NtrC family sensor kinase
MITTPVSILLVDDDPALLRLLAAAAEARGYRVETSRSAAAAPVTERRDEFDVAIVDLGSDSDAGFDAIRRIKDEAPDTEIVVTSASGSLTSAIQSYELAAFAFVEKPFDIGPLFATVERALERRQMNRDNRHLVWELQTINEIADGMSRSLEIDHVLHGALQCTLRAMGGIVGSIRIRNEATGEFEEKAYIGQRIMKDIRADAKQKLRPSDQVIATRTAFVVHDLRELFPPEYAGQLPVRSSISVPILAGNELLGTLTVGAEPAGRFGAADQRLVSVIAGQIGVAVENARLHDSVRRGKREWEQTFDAISDPIAVFDAGGALLRGNAALAAVMGRSVTELRGASCREVGFCEPGDADCFVTRALDHSGRRTEVTRPDGQIFSVMTFPVAGGPGGASVVQVAKNVTEDIRSARRLQQMSDELALANARSVAALERLQSTQAQLLQAEKLSAIGQLVAGVAHELNNPLTSVIGYAQLLEDELDNSREVRPPAELAQDLRRIAQESERAARIVRNLLAFARRQSAARAPQDVADLFSRVISLRAYELRLNGIDLITDFEANLPQVVADASQLQQALLNLVLNAEQAMRGQPVKRLQIGARHDQGAGAVELFIRDSGHGIEPANLSRIFDPFFTTREVGEGTGLGLSICYGIVRDHGGHISVASVVNGGTTFSVLLPARIEASTSEMILVAQPEQGERDYVAAALTAWGYSVVTAGTSAEGLQAVRQRVPTVAFVDRAILGADLPGWRAALSERPALALVLVSLSSEDGDVDRFGRERAQAVLAPPFQLRGIRSAIKAASKEYV